MYYEVVWGGFEVVWGGLVCFGVVWGVSTVPPGPCIIFKVCVHSSPVSLLVFCSQ